MSTYYPGDTVLIAIGMVETHPQLAGLIGVIEREVEEDVYVVVFNVDDDPRGWAGTHPVSELYGVLVPDPEDIAWFQNGWALPELPPEE